MVWKYNISILNVEKIEKQKKTDTLKKSTILK